MYEIKRKHFEKTAKREESIIINESMSEQINEWMKEWMNKWMNKWMNEWINEWMTEWMKEWRIKAIRGNKPSKGATK